MTHYHNSNLIDFPDCWEEVLPVEYRYILKLWDALRTSPRLSLLDVKRDICRFILRNRGVRGHGGMQFYLLVNELCSTLDWMWHREEETGVITLTVNTTRNLLPEWRELVGPADHGADLTFGEFRNAVTVMNLYTESSEIDKLNLLVGMLYRPMVKKQRERFSSDRFSLYRARVEKMPFRLKWGVYAWFSYFCQYLMTGTFIISGHEVSFSRLFGKGGDSDAESLGLSSILFSVSESGVFGNADQVDDTQLMKVLMKLLDDAMKADNLEKELKKRKQS